VFSTPLELGNLRVSLGSLVIFGFAIWGSFQVSKAVRFIFQEDVFPRMKLPRGVPYAASNAMHYAILMLGFFVAIMAAGVDLSSFAIIGGALGVGVGFGLQNVVNNFVSGLILLFERPVQVGDRVEVGTVIGVIQRIGIRSSTLRTFDGAEVIVPNSNLISDQVTNWTLSDRRRRIVVPIGVAYGTDPQLVLDLLLDLASKHPDVIGDPEPQAFFMAHGESSLDFELRAWTDRFEDWVRIKSDLSVAINRALAEADIEIPFPQRDLHIRSSDVLLGGSPATEGVSPPATP
jgi:small-conductance mechanosensitive channel